MPEQLTLFSEGILASPIARPGSDEARAMTVRSGHICAALLTQSGPVGSLARMLLVTSAWGSTRCYLTWKVSATPAKRLLFRLVPSMPATDVIASGLLPTPIASESHYRVKPMDTRRGNSLGNALIPTPLASGGKYRLSGDSQQSRSLQALASQGLLPTPVSADRRGRATPENVPYSLSTWAYQQMLPTPTVCGNHNRKEYPTSGGDGQAVAVKKLLPTPTSSDRSAPGPKAKYQSPHQTAKLLPTAIRMLSTPTASDAKSGYLNPSQAARDSLPGDLLRSGADGRLNPEFVEWMMGFPRGWTDLRFGPYRRLYRSGGQSETIRHGFALSAMRCTQKSLTKYLKSSSSSGGNMPQLSMLDLLEQDLEVPVEKISPAPTAPSTGWDKAAPDAQGLDGLADAWTRDELAALQAERARFVDVLRQTHAQAQAQRISLYDLAADHMEQKSAHVDRIDTSPERVENSAKNRHIAPVPAAWTGADLSEALLTTLRQAAGPLNAGELHRIVQGEPWGIAVSVEDHWTALKTLQQSGLITQRTLTAADGLNYVVFQLKPAEPGEPVGPAQILAALAAGPLSREALLANWPGQAGSATLAIESLWLQGKIAIDAEGLCRLAGQAEPADLTPCGESNVAGTAPTVCSEQTPEIEREERDLLNRSQDLSPLSQNPSCRRLPCLFTGCPGQYLPMDVGHWACSRNPEHLAWHSSPEILAYRSIYGTTYIRYSDWLSGEAKPLGRPAPAPKPEDLTLSREADVPPAEAMRPAHPLPDHAPLYALPPGLVCAFCGGELVLAADRPDVWHCTADPGHRLWSSGIGSGVWLESADLGRGRSWAVKLPAPAWMERARALAAKWAQEAAEKEAEKQQKKLRQKELKAA
jgi:hypothetical protein